MSSNPPMPATAAPRRRIGITCYPTYGGSGVVATELGIELAARGHDVHFITSSPPFRLNGREANTVSYTHLRPVTTCDQHHILSRETSSL